MLSLAVSSLILAGTMLGSEQILTPEESRAWLSVKPSIVYIANGTVTPGVAVCIDARGYFLAHRSAAAMPAVTGRTAGGAMIPLTQKSTDEITQLTLYAASTPSLTRFQPAKTYAGAKLPSKLLAVLGSQPFRADLAADGKIGIFSEQRRLLPLTEVRFESPTQSVAGALLFTLDGELAGVLNATLPADTQQFARNSLSGAQSQAAPPGTSGLGMGARGGGSGGGFATKQFGPGFMTVAYSAAPMVLQRVVEGFRSPSHRVQYPSLGILCTDAAGGGAEVRAVVDGSPAQRAGLRVGDVLVELGGQKVRSQVDFARIMLEQRIGASMAVKVLRGPDEVTLNAIVGAS